MEKGVHGIVLSYSRLLLISKKGVWSLPGGKCDLEEKYYEEFLKKEFFQKFSGTEIKVGDFYNSLKEETIPDAISYLYNETYFCFPVKGIGAPSSEINGVRYVNSRSLEEINFSNITKKVLVSLINDKLVD